MKRLRLFLIAILMVTSVFAQTEKGYVYLKNGTILKGKYQFSNDSLKLKIESAGNLWIFKTDEVERVSNNKAEMLEKFERESLNSPYFLRTEIGVLVGNSENSQSAPFSFSTSLNYQLKPCFSLGVGAGLEFLKESYLPAFLNLEYKFRNAYSSPYVFFKGGYQIPIEESRTVYYNGYQPWSSFWPGPDYQNEKMKTKGGILLNPGIGFQRMYSSGFGMSFAFGYQFHRLHYKGENDYGLDIDYNRLTIKLGIIFN